MGAMQKSYRLPVDEIKQRVSIVDIIGEKVQLRKTGRVYQGYCPFHTNTDTPALAVFPDTKTWYCFGTCGGGGDVISWVMKQDGVPFQEAVRSLAARVGIEIKDDSADYSTLYAILDASELFYNRYLGMSKTYEAEKVRDYLTNVRRIKPDTVILFGLGYSPASGRDLFYHLLEKNYTPGDMVAAGVVLEGSNLEYHDMFRDRIMFPIRDQRGKVLGFGARAVRDDQQPKFLNSHNGALFEKSSCLYGIDLAGKSIKDMDCAILVEGYFDVIACHQNGYTNTVGISGTSITEGHMRTLKQYTKNAVMVMDGDDAGVKAVRQSISSSKIHSLLEDRALSDPGGAIRSERKFGVSLRVAQLPQDSDPDDLTTKEFEHVLTKALPLVDWLVSVVGSELGEDARPRNKAAKVRSIAEVIALVPDALEADILCRQVADQFKVDYSAVKKAVESALVMPTYAAVKQVSQKFSPDVAESEFLKSCCVDMYIVHYCNRNLRYAGLEVLSEADFQDTMNRSIIGLILAALDQDDDTPDAWVTAQASPELLVVIDEWRGAEAPESQEMRAGNMLDALFVMRLSALNGRIDALAQSETPIDEKRGKITDLVASKVTIERALKSLKVHMNGVR